MDNFKGKISKEILDRLTMEDLWNSPRLKKYVEEKYPLELMERFSNDSLKVYK